MRGIDSAYAWRRLAASVALSTVGGIGMWCLAVALPTVQADLGVSRADISFAYTMNMLGFFAGGVLAGRLVDRRGIVVTGILSAVGLSAGHALAGVVRGLPDPDRLQRRRPLRAAGRRRLALVRETPRRCRRHRRLGQLHRRRPLAADRRADDPRVRLAYDLSFGRRFLPGDDDPAGADAETPAAGPRRNPDRRGRAPLAGGTRPVAQCAAGAVGGGGHRLLRRHVDAAGPYRRLLRRSRLRRGTRCGDA